MAHATVTLGRSPLVADANPQPEVEADHAGVTADVADEAPNPVVVNTIAPDAEEELANYWAAHPDERQEELEDSGFDPVDDPMDYWPVELSEPVHAGVAQAVNDSGVLDLDSVLTWEKQEAEENAADEAALFAETLALASSPLEFEAPATLIASVEEPSPFLAALLASSPLTQLLAAHRETLRAAESLTR